MKALLEQYRTLPILREELRGRVCKVCIDRNVDGTCDIDARHECVVFENLPQISRAILRVQSDRLDDYVLAIRENICDACADQNLAGECKRREEIRCALDRYLLPIVQIIEEVRGASLAL